MVALFGATSCRPDAAGNRVIDGVAYEFFDADGELATRPLAGVTVWGAGGPRYTGQTNGTGVFRLEGLADGPVSLRAEKEGYALAGTPMIPEGQGQANVYLARFDLLHRLTKTNYNIDVIPAFRPVDFSRGLFLARVVAADRMGFPLGGARVGIVGSTNISVVSGRGPKEIDPPGGAAFLDAVARRATIRTVAIGYEIPDLDLAFEPGVVVATEILAQPRTEVAPVAPPGGITFTDRTRTAGVSMNHTPLSEFSIPGVVAADLDDDGDVDLLFTNDVRDGHRLYLNSGTGSFENRTAQSGISAPAIGRGACAADVNGDGLLDLYLVGPGRQGALYLNRGSARFEQMTFSPPGPEGGYSCAFADVDNDGWVDLAVSGASSLRPHLAGVQVRREVLLYRNQGGAGFEQVFQSFGPSHSAPVAFSVLFMDYDQDGRQDLIVPEDYGRVTVFHNQSDASGIQLVDVTLALGMGLVGNWMGVTAGDINGDGHEDLFVTNISDFKSPFMGLRPSSPMNLLVTWDPEQQRFVRSEFQAGVGDTGWGWGAEFTDFDNDGALDLYTVGNYFYEAYGFEVGSVVLPEMVDFGEPIPGGIAGRRTTLFRNRGDATFDECTAAAGIDMPLDSRAEAVADLDGNGFPDLVITNLYGPPVIYFNEGNLNRWLAVKVEAKQPVGATVTVRQGNKTQVRTVRAGSSYLSQSDSRAWFGLGTEDAVSQVEVRFPSGKVVTLGPTSANQILRVQEP